MAAARCPADGATAPAAPPDSSPVAAPEVRGYTTISLLGAGGFGAVWEAADASGVRVAVKVSHGSDGEVRRRFEREASILAEVGPPHVPRLYGQGLLPDGRPYVVMERLAGRTLASEIERWEAAPLLPRAAQVASALLEAVRGLHARGVVHGDLKPENVFLVWSDDNALRATVMDFGLSRSDATAARGEQTGSTAPGTPEYMAPEQIAGRQADSRSDVYALGLLLFEVLTLRLPFIGDQRLLEYAHRCLRPPPPSDFAVVPPPIEQLVLRCLAKDPELRFSDAGALAAAFSQALLALRGSSGPTTDARPAPVPVSGTAVGGASERQTMVLIFAQGPRLSTIEAQSAVQNFAGQVAHAQTGQAAYAFGRRASDRPGRRALAAASALLARGLAERVILDVAEVTLKPRPSGLRIFSAAFSDPLRYPTASDPPGIQLTGAARVLLPSLPAQATPTARGHFLLGPASLDGHDTTSTGVSLEAPVPLIGRSDLLNALITEAQRAVDDRRPRVACVLGEAGLGKTRVAGELARLLRSHLPSAELIELAAREPLAGEPDAIFAELLRRALEIPAAVTYSDDTQQLLRERFGETARETVTSAALLLGWIAPDHPAVVAMRAAPGALRANVARAVLEALRRLAERRPVLLVLDDAHWAEDTLLDALEQATSMELPLWVCAFGRPAFVEGRPSWGQRAAHLHSDRLDPLDQQHSAELCRHLLRPVTSVPERVITRLTDRTQGSPFLLCDLVRGLRREGLVRQQTGGAWYVATEVLDQLPDSPVLEWIAGRELDQLTLDLSAQVRLVSQLSPEVTVQEVNGVLEVDRDLAGQFPMDASVAMHRLWQQGLLVRVGDGSFIFRNSMLRQGVARTVGEGMSRQIHKAALQFYRSAALPESTRRSRLAWHAAQAGERQEAAGAYLSLAESARERHNYLEADLLYTRALAQLDVGQAQGRLQAFRGRGTMRYQLGRYAGSLDDLAQARELATRAGDTATQADVLLEEAMALDWVHDYRTSREVAESARHLVLSLDAPLLRARLLLALGRSHHRFNQDPEAMELLREAIRLAKALGDEGYEVQVNAGIMLGFLLPFAGLLDEAESTLDETLRLCESKGDEYHLVAGWSNRACLWLARNDQPRFLEDIERVLAYARRLAAVNLQSRTYLNAAYFFFWRGEYAEAESFVRRLLDLDEHFVRRGGFLASGQVLLARILLGKGDRTAASKLVEEVRAEQTAALAEGKPEFLLQPNDQMLLEMSTLLITDAESDRWQRLLQGAREVAQGQELIEVFETAGLAAHRRGDDQWARQWWLEAMRVGERIPNLMSERIRRRLEEL